MLHVVTRSHDPERSLAARAAWLHFVAGMTQAEVAARLQVPGTKAHRLIARASREGFVKIFVDGPIAECAALEERIKDCFGIPSIEVSPDLGEEGLPLRSLGSAGASFLRGFIEAERDRVIGVGHGRTLAAAVRLLPELQAGERVRFVSLLGGLTRKFSASPYDVIHLLAERTGAEAYVMPVPAFANTVADREVLMAQSGVQSVFAMVRSADLYFAGIGEARSGGSLASTGLISPDEVATLERSGVEGELLGHFFDAEGGLVDTELSNRSLSVPLDALQGGNVVAIAGGLSKLQAIRAVLRSGILKGLIIDEATARRLVPAEDLQGARQPEI